MVDPGLRSARLVIQSDRRLVREALASYFASDRGFTVIGHTATGPGLQSLCVLGRPDVALIDITALTPRMVRTLRELRDSFPQLHVVVAYTSLSLELLAEAVRAGVTTFVPSSRGLDAVLRLVRQRPRQVSSELAGALAEGKALTDRELGVISLMSSGHTVSDIARLLRISPHTVDNHKRRVYAKFGVGSQSLAVARAMALGLIDPSPDCPAVVCDRDGAGRSYLPVVCGAAGPTLDRVLTALVNRGIPFVHVRTSRPVHSDHWAQWQTGPVTAVLVDPLGTDWQVPVSLQSSVIIVRSAPLDRPMVIDALAAGAQALLHSDHVSRDLPDLLSLVARGYSAVSSGRGSDLASWLAGQARHAGAGQPALTTREQEILVLMAAGYTIRQAARVLGIAAKTVENTQARLYRRLGTHNRQETLAIAHRLGLLDDPVRSPASGESASTRGSTPYPMIPEGP